MTLTKTTVAADSNGVAVNSKTTGALSLAAGDSVAIFGGWPNGCSTFTLSASDLAGNTYTQTSQFNDTDSNACYASFRSMNVANGNASNTYTVTLSASGTAVLHLEVTVIHPSSGTLSFDSAGTSTKSVTGSVSTLTSNTFSTSTTQSVAIAGCQTPNITGGTWTADTGWTMDTTAQPPNKYGETSYQEFASVQTNITTVCTRSTTGHMSVATQVFDVPNATARVVHRVIAAN